MMKRMARNPAGFEVGVFLAQVEGMCTAAVEAARSTVSLPQVPGGAMEDYLAGVHAAFPQLARPTHRDKFRDILAAGAFIKVAKDTGECPWSNMRTALGLGHVKKVDSHSHVKRAQAIYELVMGQGLYRLRRLVPSDWGIVTALIRRQPAIAAYFAEHPAELARWQCTDAPVTIELRPAINGSSCCP